MLHQICVVFSEYKNFTISKKIYICNKKAFGIEKKLSLGPSQKSCWHQKKGLDYEHMLFDNVVGWYNWILTE